MTRDFGEASLERLGCEPPAPLAARHGILAATQYKHWLSDAGYPGLHGVLHHHGQLGEVPAGARPEIVGKNDGIGGQALAEHGIAGQCQCLPRNRPAPGVHHRAHQHNAAHEVRLLQGKFNCMLGPHGMTDHHTGRHAGVRKRSTDKGRVLTHRYLAAGPGRIAESREVNGVDVGTQCQFVVQSCEIAVGNADPVQQDVGPAGRMGVRRHGGVEPAGQTAGFDVPATSKFHPASIPPASAGAG